MSTGGLLTRMNALPEVQIGTQIWMSKNYDFGGSSPASNYSNITDYGKLYTWNEAVAINYPGWHLPTYDEIIILINYVTSAGGGHLKEIGTTYWNSPNTGADNTTGFSARAAGTGSGIGSIGISAGFWASTDFITHVTTLYLYYDTANVVIFSRDKTDYASVRLIKNS